MTSSLAKYAWVALVFASLTPLAFAQVCGSDLVTYDSPRTFHRLKLSGEKTEIVGFGSCREVCANQEPICGTDARTYFNYCHFAFARLRNEKVSVRYKGHCGIGEAHVGTPRNIPDQIKESDDSVQQNELDDSSGIDSYEYYKTDDNYYGKPRFQSTDEDQNTSSDIEDNNPILKYVKFLNKAIDLSPSQARRQHSFMYTTNRPDLIEIENQERFARENQQRIAEINQKQILRQSQAETVTESMKLTDNENQKRITNEVQERIIRENAARIAREVQEQTAREKRIQKEHQERIARENREHIGREKPTGTRTKKEPNKGSLTLRFRLPKNMKSKVYDKLQSIKSVLFDE